MASFFRREMCSLSKCRIEIVERRVTEMTSKKPANIVSVDFEIDPRENQSVLPFRINGVIHFGCNKRRLKNVKVLRW